ncbi:MAG: hypothetical protein IJL98_06775 [Lachnospiraceae bacterium]|nr:hypothetical protein [Lachnospiraceae bacterium]
MNKRKNLTILVIVLVVSGCLGIGVIWFESSHRHGPSPTENISEYTEKDPEKALRLFGEDCLIQWYIKHEDELKNLQFTLFLPLDGTGYVSDRNTWLYLSEYAGLENGDNISVDIYFNDIHEQYQQASNLITRFGKELLTADDKTMEYCVTYIEKDPLQPDILFGTIKQGELKYVINYYFKKSSNNLIISSEERDAAVNQALEIIRNLLDSL